MRTLTKTRELQIATGCAAAIAALHLAGAALPTPFTWGFNELAFLPWWMMVIYGLVAAAAISAAARGPIGEYLEAAGSAMERQRWASLLTAASIVALLAILLRVRAPLLGDSFYLIRNFVEAFRGVAPLYPRDEPLATYYFSIVLALRDISTYQKFLDGFLFADILLGLGFTVTVAFLVRSCVEGAVPRLLSFVFLLTLPYMQLVFGYVEVYSVVLLSLALYALALAAHLRGRLPLVLLASLFAGVAMVHYANVLLAGSLFYAGFLEYRRRGWKRVGLAAAAVAAIFLATSVLIGFDYARFSSWVPHSHFLSVTEPADPAEQYAQAYTLFSPYHLGDLCNLFLLLAVPATCLLVLGAWRLRGHVREQTFVVALAAALLPVAAFLAVVKFDLGAARDWDVFSPYLFLLALAAVTSFWHRRESDGTRAFAGILVAALATSFAYFGVNANAESGIARYMSFLDRRTMSQNNYYGAMLQLSMYYHEEGDPVRPAALWQEYNRLFPQDPRGYLNIINNLLRVGESAHPQILATFERWRALDPAHPVMQQRYIDYCLDAGQAFYVNGNVPEAAACYRRLIDIAPGHPKGYNNLGSMLAQEGKFDSAVTMFRRAVALDSLYVEAYYNLGNALTDAGDPAQGTDAVRRAARLGSTEAQQALEQKGLTW